MKLLKIQDVAKVLSVRKQTVYRLIKTGDLKAIRLGSHRLRVLENDLETYINGSVVQTTGD